MRSLAEAKELVEFHGFRVIDIENFHQLVQAAAVIVDLHILHHRLELVAGDAGIAVHVILIEEGFCLLFVVHVALERSNDDLLMQLIEK